MKSQEWQKILVIFHSPLTILACRQLQSHIFDDISVMRKESSLFYAIVEVLLTFDSTWNIFRLFL